MKKYTVILFGILLLLITNCKQSSSIDKTSQTDPLPSWNEGNTKNSIIQFVESACDSVNEGYITVPDRIAVFDNDGTLWSEKPFYFQLFFAIDQIKALAPMHPEWKDQQPFKAVLENNMEELMKHGEHGLLQIVMASHSNMTTDEFEKLVNDWISNAKHPKFNRRYTDLVYQPMLELIQYLQKNNFKTFIVSGGGTDFIRPWSERIYNIPKNQVIGSSLNTEVANVNGEQKIKKLPGIDLINDKIGKIIGINKYIGRKPVFCAGNSDGDLAMMKYTASNKGNRFMLYLHHTDSIREWAYDRNSSVGKLDKGLEEAKANNWSVIDMEKDWKVIYPFELK